jgi:formate-dependent nitrite reductase membrane component NrfD
LRKNDSKKGRLNGTHQIYSVFLIGVGGIGMICTFIFLAGSAPQSESAYKAVVGLILSLTLIAAGMVFHADFLTIFQPCLCIQSLPSNLFLYARNQAVVRM